MHLKLYISLKIRLIGNVAFVKVNIVALAGDGGCLPPGALVIELAAAMG